MLFGTHVFLLRYGNGPLKGPNVNLHFQSAFLKRIFKSGKKVLFKKKK